MQLSKFIELLYDLKEDYGDLDIKLSFDDLEYDPVIELSQHYEEGRVVNGKILIVRKKEKTND